MKAQLLTINKKPSFNGGYYSIHDNNIAVERILTIQDDKGNTVTITNAQIGELYKTIKPALAG